MTLSEVQAELARAGLYTARVDGLWGPRTEAAMQQALTGSGARLTAADVQEAADLLRCTPAHVWAVCDVEAGPGGGFDKATKRPLILYEPHIFSRLTKRRFDASHPEVSYREWRTRPYPKGQGERYEQLFTAMKLDPGAALESASWGLFQIMGMNSALCGYSDPLSFARDHAKGEREHLVAFCRFMGARGIADDLRRGDWDAVARVYNGPGQVARYGRLLREAHARRARAA